MGSSQASTCRQLTWQGPNPALNPLLDLGARQMLLRLQDSPVTAVFRVKVWSLVVPISQVQPFVTNMLIKEISNSEKQRFTVWSQRREIEASEHTPPLPQTKSIFIVLT